MTSPDFLQSELKRLTRFKKLIYRPSCESTQDMAVDYLASHNGDLEDAIFWTDHQTRGRGRQERIWDAAAGLDLTVTLQVTAHLESAIALAAALPVAVAVAMASCRVAEEGGETSLSYGEVVYQATGVGDLVLFGLKQTDAALRQIEVRVAAAEVVA